MTHEEVCAFVQGLVKAWNARDLNRFYELLTEDVIWDDPALSAPASGKAEVRLFSQQLLRAFPDFRFDIPQPVCVAADGRSCAVPWKITATNLGLFDPPGFSPTGKRLEVRGVDMLDFRDGQVSFIHTYFDVLRAAEQLHEMRLRPHPHSSRERLLVFLQRLAARRIRRRHKKHL